MSRKSPISPNYDILDKDLSQELKFIEYLQKEENDKDYIERVLNLSVSIENGKTSRIDTLEQLQKIVQHCLNASGKLFVKGKHPKALELLESTRNLLGQVKNKDATLEKLKTVLYNNISACCLSIEDTSLAIRFIQSCLKKDSGLDINLTCVFYNNLTGIYLASKQIEKAFVCAKKSLHLLEPQIFSMIKGTPSQILKQDPGFLKCLTVLLIGYLNMGHVLEAHRLVPGVSREVLEMSPKDFYKNAYGLSRKFLGEHHSLTERLSFCASKNEFILFKEVLTDSSEPDRNQENQDSRRKLKNMLESADDEDPTLMRKSPNPLSNPQSPKAFQIKKNFMKSPVKPQRIYGPPVISASNSGIQTDDELQGYYIPKKGGHHHRYHSDAYLHPEHSSDYMHMHPRPPSSMGYGWEMQPHEARPASPDTTQIFLQLMLNQQRDLEAKINDKFKEISSISQIKQNNRNEIRIFDLKDDVKLKILQKEIEALKAQVANLKQGKDIEPNENRSGNQINTENTSHGFLPDEVNLIKITSEPGPTPEERKETDNLKHDTDVSNNFLTPHHVLPVGAGSIKSDKSSFDDHNNITLPNFDASPISKAEQPNEVKNNVKAPEWFPPPKEEPKKRTFKLDLNKVDNLQFPQDKNIKQDPDKKAAPASGNQLQTLQKDTKEISIEKDQKNLSAKTPFTFSDKASFQTAVEDSNIRVEKPAEDPKKGTIANKMDIKSPKNAGKIEFPAASKPVNKVEEVPVKQTAKPEERLVRDNTSDKLKAKKISFSIPNIIDYLDLSPSDESKMIPKYAVIKKRVFLDEETPYMLSCTAIWTKQEKNFKWQLFGAENPAKPEFNKVHADLELAYIDLQQILKLIEFKDVMPATFHIKQITSFYNLVKYFLMPFTTVKTSENGRKEIAIYPKPPNLLTNSTNDMPTVEFMGRQCVMIFTHVARNVFRIVLTDPETVGAEEAFRIDVEFDKPSFDQCFQKYGGGDPSLLSAETLMKIIQGYDEDADDDEILDFKEIMKKLTNPERKDEEEIESFKVINKDLVDDLLNSLRELENVFSSYGINDFNQLLDKKDIKYCRLKTNGSIKKTALNLVWDRPQKQILEIKIRNFFETFAPTKKIKAQGTFNYLYDSVWKHFGLNYTQIEHSDKLAICSLVSEVFYIDFFEKELKKEEYDRYEENPISFVPIEVGTYSRIFLGDTNKVPLTLSLIGIRGEPKGIRATSYNLEEVYEVGTFLHINPALWAKKETEKKKKKSERVATITLVENYRLEFVLKKCGWEMLRNWFILDRKPSRGAIANNSFLKELGFMEQLENIVEANGVAKYFRDREDTQS